MGFKAEAKQFWKDHWILSISYGVVGAFVVSRTYNALTAPKGEFWAVPGVVPDVNVPGIGSRNASLGMTTSTSTTSSSSHIPSVRNSPNAGEPSMDMPIAMMGVPNAVKRRISQGTELATDTFYQSTHEYVPTPVSEADEIAAVMGVTGSPAMAGNGWM